ncbi:MAG: hypothetical protein D4R45_00585 [Planctomycetaceae bacterium]|nr:MAG: hypothetical protein D4R45_00585 [Planctomycetaceae bacterium]
MVIMLSVSTVAMGTIVKYSDWSGSGDVWGYYASSEAEANASGSQQTEYSHASGWWELVTTESGDFDWWYYIEANAYAHIFYEEDYPSSAWGSGSATVDLSQFTTPTTNSVSAGASIDDDDCGDPPDFQYSYYYPNPKSSSNTDPFDAYAGIFCRHEVSAQATIWEGSDNVTKGWGDAGAAIDLDEHVE